MIQTKDLTISINNNILCHQLNLDIQPGKIWGILGPNASGKTTLLQTLAGLLPIKKGNIFIQDRQLSQLSRKKIAQTIGFLFQEMKMIFPQSVENFCLLARYPHLSFLKKISSHDKEIMIHALQQMDLIQKRNECITRLSGGEKRRLAIAALLTQTPSTYLLDEPTNHLDIRHQMHVLNHFRELSKKQRVSVMMSLHDINLAQSFCDNLLLIYPEGKTVQGKTCDILTENNLTRLYQHPIISLQSSWQPGKETICLSQS